MPQRDLTAKEEAFVQAFMAGGSKSDAYRVAYAADRMTAKDVSKEANTVWNREPVRARIMELKEEVAARNCVTHDAVVGMLLETYQSARAEGQHNVANATAFNLAKVSGHVVDKREIAERRQENTMPPKPDLGEMLARYKEWQRTQDHGKHREDAQATEGELPGS